MHLPEKYGDWRGVCNRPRGRPRTRPDVVLADKVYSSRAIREPLRRRGITTRYEKKVAIYLAGLHIAGIPLWSAR
ncbi:hypothetical protein [Streptomyces sp. NPDC095613]|uniref:hypothetical protein n=1 Tax=Streptomyces sp. NPDC095613 TaxID=3155540 RepID=UPI00332CC4E2